MGACSYCGKPAGMLRRKHADCESNHSRALAELVRSAQAAATGKATFETLADTAESARQSHVSPEEVHESYVRGWEMAADHFLNDGDLAPEEEHQLGAFQRELGLTQEQLDSKGAYSRVGKSLILRDILSGKVPTRVSIEEPSSFNFQKGEQPVWLFNRVDYLEDKIRREYVGQSSGLSIRVARGIYYRVGSFRGHPVERTERALVDQGTLAVTTKHLYFAGTSKSFRIRHDKIVSFVPFSDGIGLMRDAASAKLQLFITGDGWFTYNLLSNVSKL